MRRAGEATMQINLRFFASVREALNVAEEPNVEVPEGVATVGDVRRWLCNRGPVWAETLGERFRTEASVLVRHRELTPGESA